ncbi:ABC transporter substrate-binding protein [Qipengyuania sp. XHP0207]|uniref:ABC transporter substrate-binding protein n=1 Tax=Qipengyuania sp. XHP0207 TaxID=3038078 RepID=UPI00241F7BDD|nr:ABC transporter substrate-binding protein [Qipengyuania sp. XHP0207]MDG5748270.1 ABC transporter substrate-binding protein [Qipengyuania sp. XHP0207]
MRLALALIAASLVPACSGSVDDGVVDVAFIAPASELEASGLRLGAAAQHLRAAQTQGLVSLAANGEVVPAIAERWIVTDDGESYIFRIREFDLPDGSRLTAQVVRDALAVTLRRLEGTSLGLDLAKVREVRAMTGRVVEIRLSSPMPDLLQLLAQPELGLALRNASLGPMTVEKSDGGLFLEAVPPELRGLPMQPGWDEDLVAVRAYAVEPPTAAEGFANGSYELVLGGRLASLPLVDIGPLTRGTIRLDAALGLFGLDVQRRQGFLEDRDNREALSMAINRSELLNAFNIGGWAPTTRLVSPGLPGDSGTVAERWSGQSIDERRALAAARVRGWTSSAGASPSVSIWLPDGPGSDMLFDALASDFAAIGVASTREEVKSEADLVLRDRVARYGAARWFLNQFNCKVSPRVCVEDADYLVELAVDARDLTEEASFLAEAETTLTAANTYIPLGSPIRWSLVRGDIQGFLENRWNVHPLFPLTRAPI